MMGDARQDRSAREFGQAARELGHALEEVTSALTKALGLSKSRSRKLLSLENRL